MDIKKTFLLSISLILVSCHSKLSYKEQIKLYDKYTNSADSLIDIEKYKEAVDISTKAIDITDTLSLAYIKRGYAHIHLNKLSEAEDDFSEAIDIDGENSEAYKGRAITYYFSNEKGDFIDDINIYIKNHSKDFYSHYLRGEYYTEKKKYEDAIKDLSFCIKLKPNNSSLLIKRGNIYAVNNKDQLSINDFDLYTKLNPNKNNDVINFKMAILYMKDKNFQKAIIDFNKVSDSFKNIKLNELKGDCFFNLKKYIEAIKCYTIYLKNDFQNYDVFSKRGESYIKINNQLKANLDFKKSAELKWISKGIFFKYGWLIVFIILYIIINIILFTTIKEEYDQIKIKSCYLYLFFSGLFGIHYLYLKFYYRYFIFNLLFFIFIIINYYYIRSFFNNFDLLWEGIFQSKYSIWSLYSIIFLLGTDLFLIPYFVFNSNFKYRQKINNQIPIENEKKIIQIEKKLKNDINNFKKLNL